MEIYLIRRDIMNINFAINIGDIVSFVMLFLTFVGLIFAAIELRQGKNINRANLIKELYVEFYKDSDIMEVYYDIEYDNCPENGDYDVSLHNSDYGRKVDKLLSYFEVICNMYYRNIINKKDISIFSYEMCRVYSNLKIQKYFSFIEDWQKKVGYGNSYEEYIKFCQRELMCGKKIE